MESKRKITIILLIISIISVCIAGCTSNSPQVQTGDSNPLVTTPAPTISNEKACEAYNCTSNQGANINCEKYNCKSK